MLTEIDKKDYPEYTDVVLDYMHKGEVCAKVRAVYVNYFIGATFVNVNDPEDYYLCVNGPLSPIFKNYPGAVEQHDEEFEYILEALKQGYYDPNRLNFQVGSNPSVQYCAFNQ